MASNINLHIHTAHSDSGNAPAETVAMRKQEHITFDKVETDAGIEATVRNLTSVADEVSYPSKNFYTYKKYRFKCKKCNWEGSGADTVIVGDVINYEVIGCPKCRELIEFISFPSTSDVLKYGTAEDRVKAQKWIEDDKKLTAKIHSEMEQYPSLKSANQLPDIDANEIVFTLREERHNNIETIVLYWEDKEIWREWQGFEYYTSYLSMGEILREKYGERLFDFEPEYTWALGGDCLSAFEKVDNFRKMLPRFKPNIGYSIWVAKTGENGYGLVRWHCPDRKTEWLDNFVSQGKAVHIHDGRCPLTYHVRAGDILPIIRDDISLKAYVGTVGYDDAPRLAGMRNEILRYDNVIAACLSDEILCIELWDLLEISL